MSEVARTGFLIRGTKEKRKVKYFWGSITTSRFSSIISWVIRVQIPNNDMENRDIMDSFTHKFET